MKKNILGVFIGFTLLLIILCTGTGIFLITQVKGETSVNSLVLLNEIDQLTRVSSYENPEINIQEQDVQEKDTQEKSNQEQDTQEQDMQELKSPAAEQIEELKNYLKADTVKEKQNMVIWTAITFGGIMFLYVVILLCYLYLRILRPFHQLEQYANQIASGDLNIPLLYEKKNFFGEFTWAFDHMREEIKTAKMRERQAVADNKTIIATLSHDIKTPLASIKAYSEALEAHLDEDYEKRQQYIAVILRKCDEVTRLTNDLVMHSLSELDKLEMKESEVHIAVVLRAIFEGMEYEKLTITEPIQDAIVLVDEKRLNQVMENLVSNAHKYAPNSEIKVWTEIQKNIYEIHVRDYGKGILPEDIPYLFDKFYRGKNVSTEPGSGLGLYIVKYIMNRMKGDVNLINHNNGLEVKLILPYK